MSIFRRKRHIPGTVPSFLLKRRLLYSKSLSRQEAQAIALDLLEAEQLSDALAFLEKAEDRQGIAALRERAIEEGDFFLWDACCRALREEPHRHQLLQLARQAMELGKLHFARHAYERAGEQEKAAELAETLAKQFPRPESPLAVATAAERA